MFTHSDSLTDVHISKC